jgi:hypothetical protein
MLLRSLAQMRAKVVSEGDFPPPTSTSTPSLGDINLRINEGLVEVHRKVVAAGGDTVYYKEWSFQTAASGTTDYALPGDFYQLKQVRALINGSDWRDLGLYTASEEAYYLSATPGWSGEASKYRLLGKKAADGSDTGTIRIVPPPAFQQTIKLGYIFGPPVLINDNDQVDGFAGYEEFAIQYSIASFSRKIEEYEKAQLAAGEMMRISLDLLADARKRDADRPPRVQMTREQWYGRGRRRAWSGGG